MKKTIVFLMVCLVSAAAMAGVGIGDRQTKIITWKVGDKTKDFRNAFSAAALPIWTIPAKTLIYDVSAFVTTAVTGDATAFIVGDGTDDNGFLTQGFAEATGPHAFGYNNDAYRGAYLTNTATVTTAKYYSTADTLDVVMVTDSATPLATGEINFLIEFKRMK